MSQFSDLEAVARAMPHAVGPEKSTLSSMLQDPYDFLSVAVEEGLTAEHYYLPQHQLLFSALLEKYVNNEPIELVSFAQGLLDTGRLEEMGGPAALTDIYTYAPSSGYFRHHVEQIKDKHVLRSLIRTCNATIAAVYDAPAEVQQTLDEAETAVMAIRTGRETRREESTRDTILWVLRDFEARIKGPSEVHGIKTGFPDLDRMTGGLRAGNMVVIAARPAMGKTSLMMNIVEDISLDQGKGVAVFSCEMTRRELLQRLTYSRAAFDAKLLAMGHRPTRGELEKTKKAALEIANAPLIIDDLPGITIAQLRAKARRMKRELEGRGKPLELIAIDYLQLMRSHSKQAANQREREISEISAGIKGLAKELGIPIIVLAQLNRGPESRTGKNIGKPRMSDLRESGSIEQDADIVALLYRSAYYAQDDAEKDAAGGFAELDIAKNRNGETGRIPLCWDAALTRFKPGTFAEERRAEPAAAGGGWVR